MGKGKKKSEKNRGKKHKFSLTRVLKNKASRIAKRLKGFKEYKEGYIPIYLKRGLQGPNKDALYSFVLKRLTHKEFKKQ